MPRSGERSAVSMAIAVISTGQGLIRLDLSPKDLAGRTLGCADGPASFNAEGTAMGCRVISCDPVYALPADEIEQRVRACLDKVMPQIIEKRHELIWDRPFRDPDDLRARRLLALKLFRADFEAGRAAGRYVTASLPKLPFATGEFDLAVVSQFLFLYSDKIHYHVEAVDELLRVAKEVRIFPIVTLEGEPSPHFDPNDSRLKAMGFQCERRRVDYEFVRGANEVYIIRR
jgi:hypothetical protein